MPPALSLLLCASVGLSADDPAVRGRIALLLVDRGVDVFAASGNDAARVERGDAQYVLRWGDVRAAIDASVPSVAELELAQRIALGAAARRDGPSTPRVFLEARGEVPLAARARAAEAVLAEGLTLTGQAERAQRGRCLIATPRGVELRRGEPGSACRPASVVAEASPGAPATARSESARRSAEAARGRSASVRKSAEASSGGSATAMKSAEASSGGSATAMKSAGASSGGSATAMKSAGASSGGSASAMRSAEASTGGSATAMKSAEASTGGSATAMKSAEASSRGSAPARESVDAATGGSAPARSSAEASSGGSASAMKSAEASRGGAASAMKSAEASSGGSARAMKSAEASRGGAASAMKSAEASRGGAASAMKSAEVSRGGAASAMKSAEASGGGLPSAMKSATSASVAPGAPTRSAPEPEAAGAELDPATPPASDAVPPASPEPPALATSPSRAIPAPNPWVVAAYGGALVRAHGVDPAVGVDLAYQPRWYGVRAAALFVDGGRAPLRVYELLFGVGPSARLALSRVFTTGAALLLGARMHAYDLDASDRGVRWDFSVDAPLDLTYAGLDPLTVALVVRAGLDSRSRRHVDDDGVLWERGAFRFGGGVRVGLSLP